jgi:cysteine-rich repeat protein
VELDGSDDVLAAGWLLNNSTGREFTVVKLDGTNGLEAWHQEINGSDDDRDEANAVAVDAAGDVIAAGSVDNDPTRGDFTVVKLGGSDGANVICGDGVVEGTETCDDSNTDSCDGCSAVCQVEGTCGDGVWDPVCEECDDSNAVSCDGCSAACLNEGVCGDGVHDLNCEECDDGNAVPLDGCENDCTLSPFSYIPGTRITMRDVAGSPHRRKIVLISRESSLQVPGAGTAGDPTVGGGILRIMNPLTTESVAFDLPASGWRVVGARFGAFNGYKYADPGFAHGPCKVVRVRPNRLVRAVCLGKVQNLDYTLDEAEQGQLTATLQLGSEAPYCTGWGGSVGGFIDSDRGISEGLGPTGWFRGRKAPAPTSCPLP